MRSLGRISREDDALRFCDYLLTRGIESRAEGTRSGFEIWVRDEDRLDEAGRELDAFLKAPEDPKYREAASVAGALRQREAEDLERHARNRVDVRGGWAKRSRGARPITAVLAIGCIVVAIATQLGERESGIRDALAFGVLPEAEELDRRFRERAAAAGDENPPQPRNWAELRRATGITGFEQIAGGQLWRLFTPALLHFSLLHLLFNLLWLYDLGGQIERVKGRLALVLLFLVGAALSCAAQNLVSGPNFGGMSGVNYALFGFVWMRQRFSPLDGLALAPNSVPYMLGWLVLCMTGMVGPVANTAHVVGLVVGVVAGAAPHYLGRR